MFTEPEPYRNIWILTYGERPNKHYRLFIEGGMEDLGYCRPKFCAAQLPSAPPREHFRGYIHQLREGVDFPDWLVKFLDSDVDRLA